MHHCGLDCRPYTVFVRVYFPIFYRMKLPAFLVSSSLFLASALGLSAGPLGVGSDYDVIVENNFTLQGAHIHGSSAVGGNVVLSGNMSEFGNHMIAGSGPGLVV